MPTFGAPMLWTAAGDADFGTGNVVIARVYLRIAGYASETWIKTEIGMAGMLISLMLGGRSRRAGADRAMKVMRQFATKG
ncbi:hypothetical protein VY88_18845 [Azospirillum thiophilum]|uniref:Uncharacterized protein n=1 Tax=Azospirillum thiophilum TaxID=528244 RepID=A0AAC8W2U5_9PROT|nr:hypothetical protein AL072_24075 [Azospirillum thiophilum]KJR63576.1 hypothetical protein VY88_18845 [Azospirillum thiophilum]